MSKRVIQQSEIKDRELALAALRTAGMDCREEYGGKTIRITSGSLNNASIDLTTGTISSDTDFGHRKEDLGILRQHYGEAMVRRDHLKAGASLGQRANNLTIQGVKGVVGFIRCTAQG